jgi:dethiobiotin synthetase
VPRISSALRGLFVTGTDTGAGKTVVAAAIAAALRARGDRVAAYKPVVTGFDEPPDGWPTDDVLLEAAAGRAVIPHRYGPPVSPHLAAAMAGEVLSPGALIAAAQVDGILIAEGVGGLLVPLTPDFLVRDLAVALGLPLVVAARPGLGTINHTLLTLEAARAAGLRVAAVVMTPWPDEPTAMEQSNRQTVRELGRVTVCGLPPTTPERLAEAGASLPIDGWL